MTERMLKVCDSRKSTHQIMANAGFGEAVIVKDGVQVMLPQKAICNNGSIRKSVSARLTDLANLTLADAEKLHHSYGVEVTRCE